MIVIFVVQAVAFEAPIDAGVALDSATSHDLVTAAWRRCSRFSPELSQ